MNEKIESEVLKNIKPTKEEEKELQEKVDKLLEKLNSLSSKAEFILGGSLAKGTWMRNKFDIDIFAIYDPEKYSSEDISSLTKTTLKKFNPVTLHGSRDYFQIEYENLTCEIVPVLNIDDPSQAKNITDVSPLHTKWVKENSDQQIRDEIRLTKSFLKANRIYGAESYIKGFSGYVSEILTIYYKSFNNLLKKGKNWKEKTVIDINKYHKDINFEVNSSKLQSPLIVIDPVQKGRNASAALSNENFEKFKQLSKQYLKNPSQEFFQSKPLDIEKLKERNAIILKAQPLEGKEDKTGCRLEKAFNFIIRQLNNHDFKVEEADWEWDEDAIFYFILENQELEEEKIVQGPPKDIEKHAKAFKEKYNNVFEKDNKLFAKKKRDYTNANELIKNLKSSPYLKDKVKKLEFNV